MVIGGNKPAQIHREKLLQWYLTFFRRYSLVQTGAYW
jgi:hypothetical protein